MLMFRGNDGGGGGEVGSLEIGGSEVGQAMSDSSSEFSEGLLYLGGIVIGLGFVNLSDPRDFRTQSV